MLAKWLWLLPVVLAAWGAADLEIFKLRDNIIKDLGDGTTFYSWLGVKPSASPIDINKAYRKLSRQLHPDRNPGLAATERFARLNAVHKILRSANREKYDFYLRSGFPVLKEGDYTFSRYRPGLFVAILLLVVLYSVAQYVVLHVSFHRKRQFILDIIDEAREEAKSRSGIITATKTVQLSNGKKFRVEPTGAVFLLDNDSSAEPVSADSIAAPSVHDTTLLKLFAKAQRYVEKLRGEEVHTPSFAAEAHIDGLSDEGVTEEREERASKVAAKTELKKGAARRRPAANKGKAKVF